MKNVTIVDSVMGTGKTSWAIDYMNSCPNENYIYIAPLLSEDTRIVDNCKSNFYTPKNLGSGKLENLNDLLANGDNVASTHVLFRNLNDDSKRYIQDNKYILVLDEVLDVIEQISFKKDDISWMISTNRITVDESGLVHWSKEYSNYNGEFSWIKDLAENGCLYLIDDAFFMWQYPPEIFKLFKESYVLTYLFESSLLYNYFIVNDIEFNKKSIRIEDFGTRVLAEYYKPDLTKIRDKIHVYDGKLNYNIDQKKDTALSKTWLTSSYHRDDVEQLKNNLYNFYRHEMKATPKKFMWSTTKECAKRLSDTHYRYDTIDKIKKWEEKHNRPMTKEDKRPVLTFVPCNARGTNEFSGKTVLAYCLNVYTLPAYNNFFRFRSGDEITIDQDAYALSQLIQWIWRSAIRNGQEIWIYIPSNRMRRLFLNWLNSDKQVEENADEH